MRIDKGFQSVRELAENSVRGRRRVLSIGVANTIAPNAFSGFFDHVLTQLPDVEITVHILSAGEGADEVLSGKYDACILPIAPKSNLKLAVQPLFRDAICWPVNAGLKLLHSPERKYLSLTGIGLSIDPHGGVPPNSDAVVRGCGQTGGRCLGFRLCLTVGCV